MTAAHVNEEPWSAHEKTLWPEARGGLSAHLDDTFPAVAELFRRTGASVIVTASFERFNGNVWYVFVVSAPRCVPFAISASDDRLRLGDLVLKKGDVDYDGVHFWRTLSERIAPALVGNGGKH